MEDTNIFKVRLKTVEWQLLDKFYKKEANYQSYVDNKEPYETIETYTKRRLEEYLERYINNDSEWSYIDILVYWDRKDNYAYEITTGIKIPLFLKYEYVNTITNETQKNGRRFNEIFCYNYSTISKYGCFGELNCYYIDRFSSPKLNFKLSKDVLYLKEYINSAHHEVEGFTKWLKEELEYAQKIVSEKINEMIRAIHEEQERNLALEQTDCENDAHELLKTLRYQEHVKEEVPVKKKRWCPFRKQNV